MSESEKRINVLQDKVICYGLNFALFNNYISGKNHDDKVIMDKRKHEAAMIPINI